MKLMSKALFLRFIILSVLVISTSACSLLQTEPTPATDPKKPLVKSEREKVLDEADRNFQAGNYDAALILYFRIARDPAEETDLIYDKSLVGLAHLYEKSDQSEKAILALDELLKRDTKAISKVSLQVALIKNHFRVTNYYQARQIKLEIDNGYKTQNTSLREIYEALYYQTDLYYDRHIFDELTFVGDLQKYFVYVIESDLLNESDKLTDLLILYYEKFLAQLDNQILSPDIKKRLAASLIDQLSKFDRYKMPDNDSQSNLTRFSNFAEAQKRKLVERMANAKF